ncbi:MAG: hypothetical protein MJZ03_06840 [archaeon]|nr:hypothetical protein [archaeon]
MDLKNETTNQYVEGVSVSGNIGSHTYVDLGLKSGLKWATCNVGASAPTDYGDYFAWGETIPKKNYSWKTYKWCMNNHKKHTKYCTSKLYGVVDKRLILDEEDDAATANWGQEWRMPSIADLKELIRSCNWKFTDNFNGSKIAGMIGVSKKNKNVIFFPASGYFSISNILKLGVYCYVWSSSLEKKYPDGAYSLGCEGHDIGLENNVMLASYDLKGDYRAYGQSVRAVVRPFV